MIIHTVRTIEDFKLHFGFDQDGSIYETDLDEIQNACDHHGRKRRDAEVLCTLAANVSGSCLDLGTSYGRSAFKLATNLQNRGTVFTVNLLPEQQNATSGEYITHVLTREQIGSFFRERSVPNIIQLYEDTSSWTVPDEISELAVVYVDAAHDAERVYQDSMKIYDRIRPGGYICWHDFSPESRSKYDWVDDVMLGVERFLSETNPNAEIIHLCNSWIGVMRKPITSAKLRVGLVLQKEFHDQNRWTTFVTTHLINEILNRFDISWIQNQADYETMLGDIDILLSMEAGWGAPVLDLTRTSSLHKKLKTIVSYMFYSDPHDKKWREDYVLNGFDFILAFYDKPTRYHLLRLPNEQIVHFPWSIPDQWICHNSIPYNGTKQLTVFGASTHEAYDLRNWCRRFPFVESCNNSGCDNKVMTEESYLNWLSTRDVIIAAGSDDPRYLLTTPKYFEIAASGALLFAQETEDLESLGFRHLDNCIVFNRSNFETLANDYRSMPQEYLGIRARGRELIRQRHTLSVRLNFLENHMKKNIENKKRSSLTISNPQRLSIDNSTQSTLPDQQDRIFLSPEEVYLASADRMDLVLSNLKVLKSSLQVKQVDTYVSVIGGLSGLNYLSVLEPKEIVFYDINETMVRYAHLIKALIEISETHKEFISRIFCRSVDQFLEQTGNNELTIENQKKYMSLPFEKDLLEETLSLLSKEDKNIFETIISPYLKGDILYGKRNCCRLLPCWPIDHRVPVGGGEETGFDENGNRVPNTNSFFYGYGWLESAEAFNNVKSVLSHSNIKFIQFDLLKSKLIDLLDPSNNVVLHISNIDDWFPDKWREQLKSWKAQIEDQNGRLTIISSHNGLQTLQADPHERAYRALIPHVAGKVVEVTHKVPWGFHEINRTNVTTTDYLANDYEADTTIIHILIGEGLSSETFISVYRKALDLSRWVIVLEHNRASKDWDIEKSTSFLDDEELLSLLENASIGRNVKIIKTIMIAGEKDDKRNQLFVTDTGRKKMLLKHRVLLIADVPNWIFARHCRMLNRFLSDEFQFTIKFQGKHFREEDYDLIYPLEWNLVPPEHIKDPRKYVTGIRSHIWWPDLPFDQFIRFLLTNFQKVHVVSKRLFDIFRPSIPGVSYISHGIDTEFFKPTTRADQSGKKLCLGWAGNRDQLAKGFQEFIQPLGNLPDIELVFCGYADKNLTMEEMREFYDSVDAYICTSGNNEGNNNSLMEAASMGRAIITTDNGTVPEYLQDSKNALIVQREREAFVNAVERLRNDPALRVRLGNAARESAIRFWEWEERAEDYRLFFREAILRASSTPLLTPSKNTTMLLSQGEKLYAEGDLQGALEAFSKAIAIDPNNAQAYNNIGVVHWKVGNNLDALKNFRNAFKLDPNDADTLMNICDLFISIGKRHEAEELLNSYLDNHPECVAVQDMFFMIKATNSDNNITESQTTDDVHPENMASNKKKETVSGLVSIIIPTYNCREWVCDAIESSLKQTYKNCEVIVIDDGSTDDTSALLGKRYGNKIRYIFQENNGLAAARNRGIDEANGEYIQFLDSDDVISPEKIEIQVNAIKDIPGFSVSYSDYISINIYDNSINMSRYLTPRTNAESFFHSFITDWETRFSIPVHCFLFRSSIFRDFKIKFDVSLPNHEDWDCWVRIFAGNPSVIYIDQKLAVYRIKPSTMCSDRALMRYGFMQSIYKYMVQYQHDPKILALLKIKKSEMEKRYSDVSAADTWATYKKMSAKNVSQKVTCADVTYSKHPPVNLIAFYLPQYHPIPENDQWWGKGFTEWTNVAKARPLFQGHYQPHLPADLGFYDLRLPEAREAQAELAKKYGISGFCYYHYWFNGKRLLDYPLQQVLKSGKPDFPFCLCWANENWTRAWHGRQGEILIGQDYSVEDDRNHIKWLLNIFKDKRYIRINNKPLMLIYLSTDLPNAVRTTDIWRNEAHKMGEELYLCKVESAPWEYGNPALNGFDASVEFQPDWGKMGSPNGQLDGGHRVFEYEKIVKKMISKPIPPYKRFPCVTPMWDNSPRKKQSAVIFTNSTPDLYEKWLSSVISKIDKFNLDGNIIFINAWNEWAEGNHLEPDAKNGKSYLYATKKALSIATSQSNQYFTKFVSIVISTLNQLDYTKACLKSIRKFTEESHEIIFVDNGSTDGTRDFLKNLADRTEHIQLILNETNSGFAAGKNLAIKKAKGDYILLLNSDVVVTENWLDRMIQHVEQYPEIGMVGPMSNSASSYQRLKIVPYGDDMNAMHMFAKDYTAANFGKRNNILKLDSFCLLIKKDVFDIIGCLDENYGNGDFEDNDLCLQAAIAGYNSIIAHDVFVHHYNSISLKDNSIDLATIAEANHKHFRKKWEGVVEFNGDEHSVQITKELQLNKLLELGENKFIEGNLRNAVKIFERTLQLDPSNSEALNNLGVIQWQLGEAPSAIKTFQKALSSDPQNSDALNNLVQAAKETGRTDLTSTYLKENDNNVLSDYEDTSGLEKEVYCIWIVNVPGNIHQTFDEIALGLKAAFRKLGFDAPVVTDPDNISGTAIVLGCNRLAQLQISELPENIILYNLEQVQPNSPWMNDNYLELLRSHPVWDYSDINTKELEKIGVTDVTHCGIGYEPELTKIPQIKEDIDVLFYGSINDRRKQILEALKESGLNVVTLFGAYGGKRDEYIARAKIILNIHYYEAKLFEIVRISYLLANKKFIISEPGSDIEFEKIFDGGIVFSKIEDIANDCHKYLKNEKFRKAVATKGFEIFKNHSQSDFLKEVIETH